jgi:hypothetical protein
MNLLVWLPTTFLLGLVSFGLCFAFLRGCQKIYEVPMIYLTAMITALAFIYLLTAMIRPEWF